MEWAEGSYHYNVCHQLQRRQPWGLWQLWKKHLLVWHQLSWCWRDFAWRMGTGPEGAGKVQITPACELLVSEPENKGCGCCEWESGKYSAGWYLGQMSEKRAVGLAKCEKYNSKPKLVTIEHIRYLPGLPVGISLFRKFSSDWACKSSQREKYGKRNVVVSSYLYKGVGDNNFCNQTEYNVPTLNIYRELYNNTITL